MIGYWQRLSISTSTYMCSALTLNFNCLFLRIQLLITQVSHLGKSYIVYYRVFNHHHYCDLLTTQTVLILSMSHHKQSQLLTATMIEWAIVALSYTELVVCNICISRWPRRMLHRKIQKVTALRDHFLCIFSTVLINQLF